MAYRRKKRFARRKRRVGRSSRGAPKRRYVRRRMRSRKTKFTKASSQYEKITVKLQDFQVFSMVQSGAALIPASQTSLNLGFDTGLLLQPMFNGYQTFYNYFKVVRMTTKITHRPRLGAGQADYAPVDEYLCHFVAPGGVASGSTTFPFYADVFQAPFARRHLIKGKATTFSCIPRLTREVKGQSRLNGVNYDAVIHTDSPRNEWMWTQDLNQNDNPVWQCGYLATPGVDHFPNGLNVVGSQVPNWHIERWVTILFKGKRNYAGGPLSRAPIRVNAEADKGHILRTAPEHPIRENMENLIMDTVLGSVRDNIIAHGASVVKKMLTPADEL